MNAYSPGYATITISNPLLISGFSARKASQARRLHLFRATAVRKPLAGMTTTLLCTLWFGRIDNRIPVVRTLIPVRKTVSISARVLSLSRLVRLLLIRYRQFRPPLRSATSEYGASGLCLHPGTETEPAVSLSPARLIRAFHIPRSPCKRSLFLVTQVGKYTKIDSLVSNSELPRVICHRSPSEDVPESLSSYHH
jgi:hypothetical protein